MKRIKHIEIDWNKLDRLLDLEINAEHELPIRREAIPLIFVPGIMGSRLRRSGTNGEGKRDGLPNMRWDPDSYLFMAEHFITKGPGYRRRMLVGSIGEAFSEKYLSPHNVTPDNATPVDDDGFQGIIEKYHKFLRELRDHNWGAMNKIFIFPVYAFGYNWTDDIYRNGDKLKTRIKQIINEAHQISGLCEKVILITHSMGGLVARSASQQMGADADKQILGIIHGVQPVCGSPAAYWRIKAGFEGGLGLKPVQRAIGINGPEVTAVLGNIPGGLQLLPNKFYRTKSNDVSWLRIPVNGSNPISLPSSDPYKEIYEIPAIVNPPLYDWDSANTNNEYWGLVDPHLLDPDNAAPLRTVEAILRNSYSSDSFNPNSDDIKGHPTKPWDQYLVNLKKAKDFHDCLGNYVFKETLCFHGDISNGTADTVEFQITTGAGSKNYDNQSFRGYFKRAGQWMQAVLQNPRGIGDGTVPISSATAVNRKGAARSSVHPGDQHFPVDHEGAYENKNVREYVILSIVALCKKYFEEKTKA